MPRIGTFIPAELPRLHPDIPHVLEEPLHSSLQVRVGVHRVLCFQEFKDIPEGLFIQDTPLQIVNVKKDLCSQSLIHGGNGLQLWAQISVDMWPAHEADTSLDIKNFINSFSDGLGSISKMKVWPDVETGDISVNAGPSFSVLMGSNNCT